eukprot:Sspe_Gene.27296::Locus_11688_Transcript_1_1_Confidence_1.000_Length_2229::g.27296::m.27296/K03231/EEF1A; elongation factor 1-alpha
MVTTWPPQAVALFCTEGGGKGKQLLAKVLTMEVVVRMPSGGSVVVHAERHWKVDDLLRAAQEGSEDYAKGLVLEWNGVALEEDTPLSDTGVTAESVVVARPAVERQGLTVVLGGHVDAGKSTLVGRLCLELGAVTCDQAERMKQKARRWYGLSSLLDCSPMERVRGITITSKYRRLELRNWKVTVVDVPGHLDFMKSMIRSASQADVGLLLVPADGNLASAICRGNGRAREREGISRMHARVFHTLGVKQLVVCLTRMDLAGYSEEQFRMAKEETKECLIRTGWKREFVEDRVAFLPIVATTGQNVLQGATDMPWWKGQEIRLPSGKLITVTTLSDALEHAIVPPERKYHAGLVLPVATVRQTRVGTVVTGRVEEGRVRLEDRVKFARECQLAPSTRDVVRVEAFHTATHVAWAGDTIGVQVTAGNTRLQSGDVMVSVDGGVLLPCSSITAKVMVLHMAPNAIKVGYTPCCYVGTGRSPVRLTKLVWRRGRKTGGNIDPDPTYLDQGDLAEVELTPLAPLIVDTPVGCEKLSRLLFIDGWDMVMVGKVERVEFAEGRARGDGANP